jgi:predicted nucleotidyltransferase
LRELLIDRLRERIAGWDQRPRFALLFGSVARGDARGAATRH